MLTPAKIDAFWARVEKSDGCWNWRGIISAGGYGVFSAWCPLRDRRVNLPAHRVSWELSHQQPIPDGLVLDHLCRNRRCVNPAHLEPVTLRENIMRGVGYSALAARRTHCPKGHPLVGDNLTNRKDGRRECRICKAECWKRYYGRNKSRLNLLDRMDHAAGRYPRR